MLETLTRTRSLPHEPTTKAHDAVSVPMTQVWTNSKGSE